MFIGPVSRYIWLSFFKKDENPFPRYGASPNLALLLLFSDTNDNRHY